MECVRATNRPRRALSCIAALLLAVGSVGAFGVWPSAAVASGGFFDAVAFSDGLHTTGAVPGAPLSDTVVDTTGPIASAEMKSSGESDAFAAYPDPGGTVRGAPATAGNGSVAYPLYVSSSYPVSPAQSVDTPAYALSADSAATTSTADAHSGSPSAGSTAAAVQSSGSVKVTTTAVTALATSNVTNLDVGALAIGRVVSTAQAQVLGNGAVTTTSTFHADGLSVSGMTFSVGPNGVDVAGTTTPLPDTSPVTTALAGAGISVHYLAPQKTSTGVTSAGLEIDVASPAGPETTYVLGRAKADIRSTPGAAEAGAGPISGTGGVPVTGAPASGSAPAPAPVPGESLSGPASSSGSSPAIAAPANQPATSPVAFRRPVGWPRSFFLVLIVAAVVAGAAAAAAGTLGVRLP
jgi:hypothetical protein